MKKKLVKSENGISTPAQRVALLGVMTAVALALSAAEMTLPPIPMLPPGAKLGLSNLVTMYVAGTIGLVPAVCIALVKGFFSGLMCGFTAMLMSLCGGVASTFIMWLLLRLKKPFGYAGLGVSGALTHNAAQLLVAALLTTPAVIYYIPWLILFGILSGFLTGAVLRVIFPLLSRIS